MATRAEIKNNALNAFNKKFPDYATDLETFSNLMVNNENFRENVYKLTGNPESKKNGYFKDIWGIESIVEPTPEQPIAENTSVEVDITHPVQEPVTEQPAQSSAMLQDIITPVERKAVVADATRVQGVEQPKEATPVKDFASMSEEELLSEITPLQEKYAQTKQELDTYKDQIKPDYDKKKEEFGKVYQNSMQSFTANPMDMAVMAGSVKDDTDAVYDHDRYASDVNDKVYKDKKRKFDDATFEYLESPAFKEFSTRQVKDLTKRKEELETQAGELDKSYYDLARLKNDYGKRKSFLKELDNKRDAVKAQIEFIDKTIDALQAPTKSDNTWWLTNVARGFWANKGEALGTIGDVFTGFRDIKNNLSVADAYKKIADLGENITPENIDKTLTKEEKDMLLAFEEMQRTKQLIAPNLSIGYQVGEGTAVSAGFMLDFFLTRGATNALSAPVKKAVMKQFAKWLSKEALKGSKVASAAIRGTGKTAAWATDTAISTAVRTSMMSSTYENIAERMTEFDENGKPRSAWDAIALGATDALIENGSEMFGPMFSGFGKALAHTPIINKFVGMLKKLDNVSGVKAFKDEIKQFSNFLEKTGYHGFTEEFLEEVAGTALTEMRGITTNLDPNDKVAWEEFWKPENLNVTLQTLAVPMVPGMVKGTAKGIKEYGQNKQLPIGQGNASAVVPENNIQLPDNNLQTPMPATYDLGGGNVLQGRIIGDYTIEDGKLQGNPIFQHEENGEIVTTKLEERFFDRVSFDQPTDQVGDQVSDQQGQAQGQTESQAEETEYTNKTGTFNDYIDEDKTEEFAPQSADGLRLNEETTDAEIDAMLDQVEADVQAEEQLQEQAEGQTESQTEEQEQDQPTDQVSDQAEVTEQTIEKPITTEGETTAPVVEQQDVNPLFETIQEAEELGISFDDIISEQEKELKKLRSAYMKNPSKENAGKLREQTARVADYKSAYEEYKKPVPQVEAVQQAEGNNLEMSENNSRFVEENKQEDYETTDDFRRIQEESRRLSSEESQLYHRGNKKISDESRRTLGATYEGLLTRNSGSISEFWTLNGKGNEFTIAEVPSKLFHDVFEINRNYLQNGELVDLHDNYDNCKCFLSKDGLCGFAIEPNGNLISVFSLNEKSGFLYAIKDFIREQGATHLDCYLSPNQNLEEIYKKTLGFYTASTMDYNMNYDHDDIAENHNSPNIGFMVSEPVSEYKHFDKDSYEDAYNHAQAQINQTTEQQEQPTEEQEVQQVRNTLATNAVLKALEKAGVKVVRATQDMMDAVSDTAYILRKPDGTIYGLVENDTIYLTDDGLNPNTAIHEYTHLWAECVKSLYPEKWNKIKNTLKECKKLWDAVVNDPAYEDIKEDEDVIASEVLARYSGEFGEQRMLEAVASSTKEDADSIITKAKKVLSEFWNQVKAIFYSLGTKDFERSDFSDIDKISSTVLRDLLLGKNPAQILEDANMKQAQEQIRQYPMDFAQTYTGINSLNNDKRFEDDVLSLPKPINQCTKEELVQFIAKSAEYLNSIDSCIDNLTKELIAIGKEEQTSVSYHDYNRVNNVVKSLQVKKKAITDSMEFVMQRGGITAYDLAEQKQKTNQVVQEPIEQYEKEQGANQEPLDIDAIEEVGQVVEEGEPSTDKKTKGLRLGRFDAIWNKDSQGMPFNKLVRLKGGVSYKGRYVGENENGEAVYQVVKPHLSFKQKGKFVYVNNAESVEDLSEGYVFVDANGNISENQENTTRKKVYFVNNKETDRFTQAHMEDSAENKRISYTNIYDENNKPLRKKAEKVLWERTDEQLQEYVENYANNKIKEEKEKGFEYTSQVARYHHYLLNKAKKVYDYAVRLYNEDDKDFGESGASREQRKTFLENAKTILKRAEKDVASFKQRATEEQLKECEEEEKNLDTIMPLISQEEIVQGTHEQRSSLYKWLKLIGVKVHNLSAEDFADKLDKFQNTADFHLAKSMQGDVYGFVYRGQIYINQDISGSEVYVHEYSHIWIQSLKKLNPKLYMRGVELVRQMPEYETLRNAILSTYEEETPTSEQITKADEWACEELLATVMGKKGAERINQIAESGDTFVGLARRIKQWIIDAYNSLKSIMDDFTDKELDSLTVESFSDMMLKDLANLVDMQSTSIRDEVKTIEAQRARMEDIKRRFLDYVGGVESGSLDTAYGLARAQLRFIIKEIRKIQPQRSNKIPLSACREIYKQLLVASKTNFRSGEVKSNTYTRPLMDAYCGLLTLFNNIENTNVEIAQSKVDKTFNRAIKGTKKQDIKRGGVMSYTYADAVMSLREQTDEELLDGTNTTLTNNKRAELNDKFDKLAEEIKDLQEQLNNANVENKAEIERKIREKQTSYNMLAVEDLAITAQEERRKVAEAEAQMSEHIKRIDNLREQIKQDQHSRSTIQSEVVVNAQQEESKKYSVNILNKRIKEANEEIRYIEYLMSVTSQEILEHNNKQLIACNAILEAGRSEYHAMVYKSAKKKAEFLAGAINDVQVGDGKQVSKLRDNINNVVQKTLGSLDYLIDRISVNALKGNSFLRKHFLDEYNKKNSEYTKQMQEHMNMLDAKISEIFKGVAGKKIKKVENINDLSYLLNEVLFGKKIEYDVPRADEEEPEHVVLELNMSQAMEIYLQARQEDGRRALNKGGITDDIIDEIVSRFDEPSMVAYKEWADYMQLELLPSLKERFNKRYREQFFIDIPSVENYFPIKAKLSTTDELLKSLSSSEYRFNASTVANNLYARSHNSAIELRDVDINPANVLAQYLCNMEHWYHMSELQEKTNWLVNSGKFQRLLKQQGESTRKHFNQSLIYTVSNTDSHSGIGNFVSMYQLGMVGFRGMTAIKQLASIPAFFIYATNKYVRNEMALNASPHRLFGRIERAKELFPTIKERIESGSLGSELLLEYEDSDGLLKRETKRKINEWALWANRRVDIYVVANGTLAVYDGMVKQKLSEGYSQAEAEAFAFTYAMNAFEATQQSSNRAYLAPFQQDRSWSLITGFQNASYAYARRFVEMSRFFKDWTSGAYKEQIENTIKYYVEFEGFSRERATELANEDFKRSRISAFNTLAGLGLSNYLFKYGITGFVQWLFGYDGDDDEDNEKRLLSIYTEHFLNATGGVLLEGLAGGNIMTDLINQVIKGEKPRKVDFMGLLKPLGEGATGFAEGVQMLSDEDKENSDAWFKIIQSFALAYPAPMDAQTLSKIIVGIKDMFTNYPNKEEFWIGFLNFMNLPTSQMANILQAVEGYDSNRDASEDPRYINAYNWASRLWEYIK